MLSQDGASRANESYQGLDGKAEERSLRRKSTVIDSFGAKVSGADDSW